MSAMKASRNPPSGLAIHRLSEASRPRIAPKSVHSTRVPHYEKRPAMPSVDELEKEIEECAHARNTLPTLPRDRPVPALPKALAKARDEDAR